MCIYVDSSSDDNNNEVLIGAVVGVLCVVIIIMVITIISSYGCIASEKDNTQVRITINKNITYVQVYMHTVHTYVAISAYKLPIDVIYILHSYGYHYMGTFFNRILFNGFHGLI